MCCVFFGGDIVGFLRFDDSSAIFCTSGLGINNDRRMWLHSSMGRPSRLGIAGMNVIISPAP